MHSNSDYTIALFAARDPIERHFIVSSHQKKILTPRYLHEVDHIWRNNKNFYDIRKCIRIYEKTYSYY